MRGWGFIAWDRQIEKGPTEEGLGYRPSVAVREMAASEPGERAVH